MHVTRPNEPDAAKAEGVADLIREATRGDQGAWRGLVGLYAPRVFALARSRLRSPELAEEITQSVFVTVAAKLTRGAYAEQGKFESWLFRIAMNRIRDEGRRSRRRGLASQSDGLADAAVLPEWPGGDGGTLQRLRRAVERLSEADREVVELRHHACMSFREMSELLGEPIGTLLARHHRALRKLKELMGGSEGQSGDE